MNTAPPPGAKAGITRKVSERRQRRTGAGTRTLNSDRVHCLCQKIPDRCRDRFELGVVDRRHGCDRINGADFDAAADFAQDDVAGQHGAHPGLDADGLMRHPGIASAEYAVGRHFDIQLLFHGRLDVNFCQDAEPLSGKGFARSGFYRVDPRVRNYSADRICHRRFLPILSRTVFSSEIADSDPGLKLEQRGSDRKVPARSYLGAEDIAPAARS